MGSLREGREASRDGGDGTERMGGGGGREGRGERRRGERREEKRRRGERRAKSARSWRHTPEWSTAMHRQGTAESDPPNKPGT